ncbi:MAG: ABC transporter permease [Anaerovoracaceae bacterium]|nr:ABC transporter permease [Clostridiales bacterium]
MNFLRLAKRDDLPKKTEWLIRAGAILLSLVFSGLILLLFKLNPIEVFKTIIIGSVGSEMRIHQTIIKSVPLIITSLGVLVAFKMKFWNIGGEGQILMGAFAASYVALFFPEMPRAMALILMIIAAVIGGGIWAFIPAFFKAKMGINETIFTLMMNYVAIKFVTFLQYQAWMDPNAKGFPRIAPFPEWALLPKLFGVHIGYIIAIILVVLVHLFIKYTKKGYEITVVGESIETARYAGMNINKIIVIAMLISGGLCGIAGMIQVSGVEKTLAVGISGGYGFTAIITAWLARLNAISALFVCIVFAMLLQGGAYIQVNLNVPSTVANVVQGTILFFVLGSEFFLQYRLIPAKRILKEGKEAA